MKTLRVILTIFTVALLIIIGLIIIKFHKPNKLNVSENVIKGYDISFKNEEWLGLKTTHLACVGMPQIQSNISY